MLVSLIIAVYKDIQALELILDTLIYQTYENFEVLVAEDGQSVDMLKFIQKARKKYNFIIKHTTQEDIGVRKARSQNNAILAASGEYLVFIDGDCLLYSTFIDGHATLAQKGEVLSGRRINLNENLTRKIKDETLNAIEIEKNFLSKFLYFAFNKEVKFEQGIYLNPRSWFYKHYIQSRERSTAILGCNFSCWRDDLITLNGFDEGYGESAVSDDMDWDWRFEGYGLKIKSCKNVANMMHLWHRAHNRGDASHQVEKMHKNRESKLYICNKGLNTH